MEAGQAYELFWRLTPHETQIIFEGAARRLQREHNDHMSLAWHVVALQRADRSDRFPRLKTLLKSPDAKKPDRRRPGGWEAQLQAFSAWVSSYKKG